MDFPTLLVVATLVTGGLWLLEILWWRPLRGRRNGPEAAQREPLVVEYARAFFPVIFAVLVIRSFVVEPFRIPSGSMMPTLLVGDFILVNKFAYGLRLPVIHTKLVEVGEPERGDTVVFRYPEDPSTDYIKRVVGLPGDHVVYAGKVLTINGEPMPQHYLGPYMGIGSGAGMTGAQVREEALDGVDHRILILGERMGGRFETRVPPGHYFVMGDNRDNSRDSRFWGTVPEGNLVGKAFFIWMNWDPHRDGIAWDRLGSGIE